MPLNFKHLLDEFCFFSASCGIYSLCWMWFLIKKHILHVLHVTATTIRWSFNLLTVIQQQFFKHARKILELSLGSIFCRVRFQKSSLVINVHSYKRPISDIVLQNINSFWAVRFSEDLFWKENLIVLVDRFHMQQGYVATFRRQFPLNH